MLLFAYYKLASVHQLLKTVVQHKFRLHHVAMFDYQHAVISAISSCGHLL